MFVSSKVSESTHNVPSFVLGLDPELASVVPSKILSIGSGSIIDFFENQKLISTLHRFVVKHPDVDFVYKFSTREEFFTPGNKSFFPKGKNPLLDGGLPDSLDKELYVTGSTAVKQLQRIVNQHAHNAKKHDTPIMKRWDASDVDLFIPGCEKASRVCLGDLDMVFSVKPDIASVLKAFDLSCARVAFDFKWNMYVSAQALLAMATGIVYLPHCFGHLESYRKAFAEFNPSFSKEDMQKLTRDLYGKMKDRRRKYYGRDFFVRLVHYNYPVDCLKYQKVRGYTECK